MKRERQYNTIHHFSFGERFDEMLMNVYCSVCQCVKVSIHQFIGISPLINSAVESNRGEHRHPQAGRTDFHPADRQGKADVAGEKKKAADIIADTAAGFWEAKSHSSLGRFLHAPLTLMLKTPNEPAGLHPAAHPRLSRAAMTADRH